MACLYERKNSPYLWLKYLDQAGVERRESTKLRKSIPSQRQSAQVQLRQKQLAELKAGKKQPGQYWDAWVDEYLVSRYENKLLTLERYRISWKNLRAFFQSLKIVLPTQLTYQHCEQYMEWRKTSHLECGIYKCGHNNARYDLKILHRICDQAIKRGYIDRNPCSSLGIPKHKPREKPELSDEDLALIRHKLKELKSPEWMSACFEIAIHQGCRLRETSLPLSRIDLKKRTILFKAKGDKDFSAPLHPKLVPKIRAMLKKGQTHTCQLPRMASKEWWRFFKKIGLQEKGVSFHCTRVTVITRLIREGKPENVVKKIVNHASTEINRIYQRLGVEDVRNALDSLRV
jgi:site-specific recombinase XerD